MKNLKMLRLNHDPPTQALTFPIRTHCCSSISFTISFSITPSPGVPPLPTPKDPLPGRDRDHQRWPRNLTRWSWLTKNSSTPPTEDLIPDPPLAHEYLWLHQGPPPPVINQNVAHLQKLVAPVPPPNKQNKQSVSSQLRKKQPAKSHNHSLIPRASK